MSQTDQDDSSDRKPEQGRCSLHEAIEQANRVIEELRAEIARSRALSRSEAELAREIDRIGKESDTSSKQGSGS